MSAAKTESAAAEIAADAGAAPEQNLEHLLQELKAASKLMDDIAAASDLLPTPYRLKADMLGRNLMMLYRTGQRSAGLPQDGVSAPTGKT